MTRQKLFVFMAAVCVIVSPAVGAESLVIVRVETTLGTPIESAAIELRELGTREDYSDRFKNHRAQVPHGYYSLRVGEGGFKIHERVIRVLQPVVYVRVGLAVGPIRLLKLSGTLKGCKEVGDKEVEEVGKKSGRSRRSQEVGDRLRLLPLKQTIASRLGRAPPRRSQSFKNNFSHPFNHLPSNPPRRRTIGPYTRSEESFRAIIAQQAQQVQHYNLKPVNAQ